MAVERLFVGEGIKEAELKKYLSEELKRAGLADVVIQRTPLVTRIIVYCDRPALVIGRKGKNIKDITTTVEKVFRIEKPELEVKKIDEPNLEPNIVAYRIASALERGMKPRKVGYKALQSILRAGAKGAQIIMAGKLVGKGGRARTLKMSAGYMKKCGYPSFTQILSGYMIACCKPGVIGIKVKIVPKDVHFPDEITLVSKEQFEVPEIEEEVLEGDFTDEVTGDQKQDAKPETKKEEGQKGARQKQDAKPEAKKEEGQKGARQKQDAKPEAKIAEKPKAERLTPDKQEQDAKAPSQPKDKQKKEAKSFKQVAEKPVTGVKETKKKAIKAVKKED